MIDLTKKPELPDHMVKCEHCGIKMNKTKMKEHGYICFHCGGKNKGAGWAKFVAEDGPEDLLTYGLIGIVIFLGIVAFWFLSNMVPAG